MSLSERQRESIQRLAERMQFERMMRPNDPADVVEPVNLRTRLLASFLLALGSPASCLPIFALLALVFAILSRATGIAAGYMVVAIVAVFWVASYLAVRAVANSWRQRRLTGRRIWWPLQATLCAVALAAWELYNGGDVDIVIFLWIPVGLWWSMSMLLSLTNWSGLALARWFVLPLCILVLASARITDGFFEYRFDASVDELTKAATAKPTVSSGTYGSFDIVFRRTVRGCEAAFKIDGWWVDDNRTIAYCPDGFSERNFDYYDPSPLGKGWYEIGFYAN